MRFSVLFYLSVIACFPGAVAAQEKVPWATKPEQLRVTLQVVHALEEGPLVCKVILKNVSNSDIAFGYSRWGKQAYCKLDVEWKKKKELPRPYLVSGIMGPFKQRLSPGASTEEIFFLHHDYLSLPPGQAKVHFGWRICRIAENTKDKERSARWYLEPVFDLKDSLIIEIPKATPSTSGPMLRNLEIDFARIAAAQVKSPDYWITSDDSAWEFIRIIKGSRRSEFVPLLIKAVDTLPGPANRSTLIGTIYESIERPDDGFAVLAEYLGRSEPSAATDIFDYWASVDQEFEWSRSRHEELQNPKPRPKYFRNFPDDESYQRWMRGYLLDEEDAWLSSRRHLDTRLTDAQFERLRNMPNVWVRALLFSHYPDKCSARWVDALLHDLKGTLTPFDEAQVKELLRALDSESFKAREEATRRLTTLDPAVIPLLQAAHKKSASAEVTHRLAGVLKKLEARQLPRLVTRTISHLAYPSTSANDRMLEVLTAAKTPNRITDFAEEEMARARSKR